MNALMNYDNVMLLRHINIFIMTFLIRVTEYLIKCTTHKQKQLHKFYTEKE